MVEEKKGSELIKEKGKIKIDYKNIDVADIMEQIKRKIAKDQKKLPQEECSKEELPFTPPPHLPKAPEEANEAKKKIKKFLLKVMKPISPLIKLLILPVYDEFRQTHCLLHQTNIRLDSVYPELGRLNGAINNVEKRLDYVNDSVNQRIDESISKVERRMDSVDQSLNQRIDESISKVEKKVDHVDKSLNRRLNAAVGNVERRVDDVSKTLNQRLNFTIDDLGKTMEYTKLLHNLTHNIVVELSKLKIEEENLKLMTKIMKKDFEFLRRKERSLEKNIFR